MLTQPFVQAVINHNSTRPLILDLKLCARNGQGERQMVDVCADVSVSIWQPISRHHLSRFLAVAYDKLTVDLSSLRSSLSLS